MSLRNPLATARGKGSAKSGVQHWWAQRLTAIALVPLTLWFVWSLACIAGAPHAEVVAWLAQPAVAIITAIYAVTLFHHSQLGLQVVIEDYVHSEGTKIASLIAVKFIHVLLAVTSVFSVLLVAVGR